MSHQKGYVTVPFYRIIPTVRRPAPFMKPRGITSTLRANKLRFIRPLPPFKFIKMTNQLSKGCRRGFMFFQKYICRRWRTLCAHYFRLFLHHRFASLFISQPRKRNFQRDKGGKQHDDNSSKPWHRHG